jgi:uncharacterized protein (TIGR02118 family)
MIKLVTLLVRRDGLDHQEFVDYWMTEHAPRARELPNVLKYVTDLPTDQEQSEYDGIAELYFEDVSELKAAFESPTGQAVEADLQNFAKPDAGPTLIVEEDVQLDETESP